MTHRVGVSMDEKTIERFLTRVKRMPDGCWIWQGAPSPGTKKGTGGYGRIMIAGVQMRAHRVAYEIWNGAPGDLFVLHTCDVRMCVNPEHLFLGTHLDNMRDMAAKGRAGGNHRGVHNGRAKNTPTDVIEIRRLFAAGMTQREIGRRYNLAGTTVHGIVRLKIWAHVK